MLACGGTPMTFESGIASGGIDWVGKPTFADTDVAIRGLSKALVVKG